MRDSGVGGGRAGHCVAWRLKTGLNALSRWFWGPQLQPRAAARLFSVAEQVDALPRSH